MSSLEDALARLLRFSFEGPGDHVLPEPAVRGLRVRIRPGWWHHAGCLGGDTDVWFPDERSKPSPLVARVCGACPVRKSCLASAVLHDEEGIWGGTRRGQRLHARARLLNDEPAGDVLGDLLHSPLPRSEYSIPDPIAITPIAVPAAEGAEWKEAS